MARAAGLARLAGVRVALLGGDLNLTRRLAARALGRRVVGAGVLWLTVPQRGWRVIRVEAYDVGGDHEAPLVTLAHMRTATVVRVLVINCMSVSTGSLHAAAILRAGMRLRPDVVLASECRDFWAAHVDRDSRYDWWQPGEEGSSESGTLVGVRRSSATLSEPALRVASRATREGDGIDQRSIALARVTWRP